MIFPVSIFPFMVNRITKARTQNDRREGLQQPESETNQAAPVVARVSVFGFLKSCNFPSSHRAQNSQSGFSHSTYRFAREKLFRNHFVIASTLSRFVNNSLKVFACCYVTIAICGYAQTNSNFVTAKTNAVKKIQSPPVPTHLITLQRIESQIAQIELEKKRLSDMHYTLSQRWDLQNRSGQPTAQTKQQINLIDERQKVIAKALSQLQLQAMDIRQNYGIPEPKKKR